jgi:predicted nucleic acid-binding protein
VLRALREHRRHVFWEEGFSYAEVPHRSLQGAKQVTDAWLSEAARRRKAKLATLDSALAALHRDVAVLIREVAAR